MGLNVLPAFFEIVNSGWLQVLGKGYFKVFVYNQIWFKQFFLKLIIVMLARWISCNWILIFFSSIPVHCGSIRQTASIVSMSVECLRTGDKARVHFRFIKHPEYLRPGQRLVFREGRTKAVGNVVGVLAGPQPAQSHHKHKPKANHPSQVIQVKPATTAH